MPKNNTPENTTLDIKLPTMTYMPDEMECDVAIIGGGPNGLITAAYLARAGLDVILLERRFEVGGGLATEETLFPCFFTNTHATYHMMVDYIPAIQDFDLSQHSLQFVKPNRQSGIIFKDGTSLMIHSKIRDTADQLLKFSREDSKTFEEYAVLYTRMMDEILAPSTYYKPIPPLDLAVCFERTEIGKELAKISEESPVEIIENLFTNERIRALFLYITSMWGVSPTDTGLGFMVPLLITRCGMNKCISIGGSHKFASSLAKEVVRNKGLILENAEVTKILVEGGKAAGVQMHDGRVIKAKTVVSSLDPHSTFLNLVGEDNCPEDLAGSAKNWNWDKWSFFTSHLAINEPLKYRAEDKTINECFMNIIGIESMDDVIALADNAQAGDIRDIAGHSSVETLWDKTLARTGKHTAFFQMITPGEVDGGWDSRKKEVEEIALGRWSEYVENLGPDNIIMKSSETPLDIERRIPCMKFGSLKHGDYNSMQMGYFRPNDLCSQSATPIEGLYVCGASTYPGGLIIGGPGYIAANAIAEDLEIKKWWKLPDHVEKYIEEYLE